VKKKEKQGLYQKTIDQLEKEIREKEKELANLKLELRAGKLKNVRQVMAQRHRLACLKTILRKKELST